MATQPQIKIEKGVPVADGRRAAKYPWKEMAPGDSFTVPAASLPGGGGPTLRRCASAALGAGNYRVAKEGDGFRVWRIA